jgi:hypothetical protein
MTKSAGFSPLLQKKPWPGSVCRVSRVSRVSRASKGNRVCRSVGWERGDVPLKKGTMLSRSEKNTIRPTRRGRIVSQGIEAYCCKGVSRVIRVMEVLDNLCSGAERGQSTCDVMLMLCDASGYCEMLSQCCVIMSWCCVMLSRCCVMLTGRIRYPNMD